MLRNSRIMLTQFMMYLLVGGLSFFVELSSFQGMLFMYVPLVVASVLSFILANIANYFISLRLAFVSGRFGLGVELLRLLIIVLVGLALNTLIVVVLVNGMNVLPALAKVLTLPVVLLWNFLGRSLLVFQRNMLPTSIESTFLKPD